MIFFFDNRWLSLFEKLYGCKNDKGNQHFGSISTEVYLLLLTGIILAFLYCILSLVFENGFSNKACGEVWKITLNLTSNVKISDLMECSRNFQYLITWF